MAKVKEECGGYKLTFKDVYLVPEMDSTLLSERKLEEAGFQLMTCNGVKDVYDGKELFLRGHWDENQKMYVVSTEYYEKNGKEV